MRTKARVYFFRDGVELTDHPANGLGFCGAGAYVAYFGKTPVRSFLEVEGRDGRVYGLFPDAFDGPVRVKIWCPARGSEFMGFATRADAVAAGAVATEHKCDPPRDGRDVEFCGWHPWENYLKRVDAVRQHVA